MSNKIILLSTIVLIAVLTIFNLPQTLIQDSSDTEFILNIPFKDFQKSIRRSNFEQETLKINNAVLIEKKWTDMNLVIQRPLKPTRYLEFSGRLFAKVSIDDPQIGKTNVELIEDICLSTDKIEIKTKLAKPLSIGISDVEQEVLIFPDGQLTVVRLSSSVTLKRFVPRFMADHAKKQVKTATEQSILKMESILRNLK